MKWINALDIEQWSDSIAARDSFPGLVRDLIVASVGQINDIRFPSGEKGQVPGFDGWLEATGAPPYVPVGLSIWEFGSNGDQASKFEKDYEKRVAEIDISKRKDMTFVFVSPRTWNKPRKKLPDFVEDYKIKADFKDVVYIDGAKLEDWLQKCSAVSARYAREILGRLPQYGARSTDEFWNEYTRRFKPHINEKVVLAAREEQALQIVKHLMGKLGSLVFISDGPDEVTAVSVAAIRTANAQVREFLEARTLIIDTDEAGRFLATGGRYSYIISQSVTQVAGLLSSSGPTVSGLSFNSTNQGFIRLYRPSTREMCQALMTMGMSEDSANRLASKSGRSLTILERHIPAASYAQPHWAQEGHKLIPALLAGGWDQRHEGDKAILAELAQVSDYSSFEAHIRPFLNKNDSPLDREGGVWKLRAPVDAIMHLSSLLGQEHLEQLGKIATRVFSGTPPDEGEERFGVSNSPYSSRIRDGIANTLLIFSALHSELGLEMGVDPEIFVQEVVKGLPGLHDDARVMLALDSQMPLLMEAATDPLLSALELMLESDESVIAPFFATRHEYGFPLSNIGNLLNALEVAAWDPRYLLRVSLILARLAEMNPAAESRNRPLETLRDIFIAWKPETNATLAERLDALDVLNDNYRDIGWSILVSLLPRPYGHKSASPQPRYREAGASQRERLTVALVSENYDAIIGRVLSLLGSNCEHWIAVLSSFPQFSLERQAQFLDALEGFTEQVQGEQRISLRRAVRALADRHSRFREAKWALGNAILGRLEQIVKRLESGSLTDNARILFDEWSPLGSSDFLKAEIEISEKRRLAIARILETNDLDAILQLCSQVRIPQALAGAVAGATTDLKLIFDLLDRAPFIGSKQAFATSLAGTSRRQLGTDFDADFLAEAKVRNWSDERVCSLLLDWPEEPTTWDLVSKFGEAVYTCFWKRRETRFFTGSPKNLVRLIEYYLMAGRAGAALVVTHGRENELDWSTIKKILNLRVSEINKSADTDVMDGYHLQELFKKLGDREDVSKEELAVYEFKYFPMLEDSGQKLFIFDHMAERPEIYMLLLRAVYLEDGADSDAVKISDQEKQLASSAYRIINAFNKVPGEKSDIIDGALLNAWVDGLKSLAEKWKRNGIVDSHIGRVLAHAKETDGCWPPAPVVEIIERLKSANLERGIAIERYNMRGVHTKELFEGGDQERALANQYRTWSSKLSSKSSRTKSLLDSIAKDWEQEAKFADQAAARDRLRFE